MKLFVKILLFVLVSLTANVKVINAATTSTDIQEITTFSSFHTEIDRITDFDEKLREFLELLDNEYDDLDEDLEQLLVDYLESR